MSGAEKGGSLPAFSVGSGIDFEDELEFVVEERGRGCDSKSPFVRPPLSSASRSASRFIRKTFPNELAIVLLFNPIFP